MPFRAMRENFSPCHRLASGRCSTAKMRTHARTPCVLQSICNKTRANMPFRAMREYTHALRLVSELPDLRAGCANPYVCTHTLGSCAERIAKNKRHPPFGGAFFLCEMKRVQTCHFALRAKIFRLAIASQAGAALRRKCEPIRVHGTRWVLARSASPKTKGTHHLVDAFCFLVTRTGIEPMPSP